MVGRPPLAPVIGSYLPCYVIFPIQTSTLINKVCLKLCFSIIVQKQLFAKFLSFALFVGVGYRQKTRNISPLNRPTASKVHPSKILLRMLGTEEKKAWKLAFESFFGKVTSVKKRLEREKIESIDSNLRLSIEVCVFPGRSQRLPFFAQTEAFAGMTKLHHFKPILYNFLPPFSNTSFSYIRVLPQRWRC